MQSRYANAHVPTRRHDSKELRLHRAACRYIDQVTPWVLYRSDGGGLPLSKTQAGIFKSLQKGPGFPDLMILHPSRDYHAAFFELKADTRNPYLKIGPRKGLLSTNPHIQQQAANLVALTKLGYYADFAVGLDDFIKKYNYYMEIPENTELF
jgi:hypothetical protein